MLAPSLPALVQCPYETGFSCPSTKLTKSLPMVSPWSLLRSSHRNSCWKKFAASKALKAGRASLSGETRLPAGCEQCSRLFACLAMVKALLHCVQSGSAAVVILRQIGRTTSGPTARFWAHCSLLGPLFSSRPTVQHCWAH